MNDYLEGVHTMHATRFLQTITLLALLAAGCNGAAAPAPELPPAEASPTVEATLSVSTPTSALAEATDAPAAPVPLEDANVASWPEGAVYGKLVEQLGRQFHLDENGLARVVVFGGVERVIPDAVANVPEPMRYILGKVQPYWNEAANEWRLPDATGEDWFHFVYANSEDGEWVGIPSGPLSFVSPNTGVNYQIERSTLNLISFESGDDASIEHFTRYIDYLWYMMLTGDRAGYKNENGGYWVSPNYIADETIRQWFVNHPTISNYRYLERVHMKLSLNGGRVNPLTVIVQEEAGAISTNSVRLRIWTFGAEGAPEFVGTHKSGINGGYRISFEGGGMVIDLVQQAGRFDPPSPYNPFKNFENSALASMPFGSIVLDQIAIGVNGVRPDKKKPEVNITPYRLGFVGSFSGEGGMNLFEGRGGAVPWE